MADPNPFTGSTTSRARKPTGIVSFTVQFIGTGMAQMVTNTVKICEKQAQIYCWVQK
jgi:hypothetical protein